MIARTERGLMIRPSALSPLVPYRYALEGETRAVLADYDDGLARGPDSGCDRI